MDLLGANPDLGLLGDAVGRTEATGDGRRIDPGGRVTDEGYDGKVARKLQTTCGEIGDGRHEVRPLREDHRGRATLQARTEKLADIVCRQRLGGKLHLDAHALLLGDAGNGRHRLAHLYLAAEERHEEVAMAQWNQAFHRDVDQVAVADSQGVDALGAKRTEHRGDFGRMTRDAGEEVLVRLHQDDMRGTRLHHLGMRGLTKFRPLDVTEVDEAEAITFGLQSLAELKNTHTDRRVVSDDWLGGEHQDFEMTRGTMGAGNAGGDLEASLAPTTDQDLALDQEGDRLLDGREADLMLVGQVPARGEQPLPAFLTNLGLNPIGEVLKNGFFLEFRGGHGDL